MELPKTGTEYAIWVGMQFPVLGAAALVVWWVLRWTGKKQADEIARIDAQNAKLLAEKDQRLSDLKAEKEKRIEELKAEVKELKEKLSRKRKANDETTEKDEGDGGAKS